MSTSTNQQTLGLRERLAAQRAALVGSPPAISEKPAAPATSPVDTSGPIVPYYAKGGIPVENIPAKYVGINPPESALPPAPPVGSTPAPAAVVAPRVKTAEQIAAEGPQTTTGPRRGPGRPKTFKPPIDANAESDVAVAAPSTGETVSVTWAEETISPVAYNVVKVGPFSATGSVRAGESLAEATARVYAELVAFAETQRAAKLVSFKGTLDQIGGSR